MYNVRFCFVNNGRTYTHARMKQIWNVSINFWLNMAFVKYDYSVLYKKKKTK